jgi:hypothetical protein
MLTRTVLPASLLPVTVRARVLLTDGALMDGAAGATVSTVTATAAEGLLGLPAASVAVAVKLKIPSAGTV